MAEFEVNFEGELHVIKSNLPMFTSRQLCIFDPNSQLCIPGQRRKFRQWPTQISALIIMTELLWFLMQTGLNDRL